MKELFLVLIGGICSALGGCIAIWYHVKKARQIRMEEVRGEQQLKNRDTKMKNKSEKLFKEYLNSNGYRGKWVHEPEIPGKRKRVDYLLSYSNIEFFFEVKELRKKPDEPTKLPAWIDPYSGLRSEIHEVRKQFKEYKEYSCSLVVYNIDDGQARLKPIDVFGAMLGNHGITLGYDAANEEFAIQSARAGFLNRGKMGNRDKPHHTTINAILVLDVFINDLELERAMSREIQKQNRELTLVEITDVREKLYPSYPAEQVPRVIAIKNPYARIEFQNNLINGPFDEIWESRDDDISRVFAGNKLKELEALKDSMFPACSL